MNCGCKSKLLHFCKPFCILSCIIIIISSSNLCTLVLFSYFPPPCSSYSSFLFISSLSSRAAQLHSSSLNVQSIEIVKLQKDIITPIR